MKTKLVDSRTRPWAGKTFQYVLGRYELHSCGLFMHFDMEDEHVPPVARSFTSCPDQLKHLASQYELTVDVSPFSGTRCSDTCTMYGNWSASGFKHVSPHLEIGRRAFGDNLSPFMAHELSHLWWASLPAEAKARYQDFLISQTSSSDFDVTEYAHSFFVEYQSRKKKLGTKTSSLSSPGPIKWTVEKWVTESFCETVALLSFPDYKSDESWTVSVDLEARREAIASHTGLIL